MDSSLFSFLGLWNEKTLHKPSSKQMVQCSRSSNAMSLAGRYSMLPSSISLSSSSSLFIADVGRGCCRSDSALAPRSAIICLAAEDDVEADGVIA